MKKLFALLLALVMALSLVACGEKKDDTGDKTDDSNPSTGMELTQATDLVIATGGTSGAWYPIGVSIADTLTNVDNNLFVTSELEEGIFLADRLVVLTNQPCQVKKVMDVNLPRPRTFDMMAMPEYVDIKREVLELLLSRNPVAGKFLEAYSQLWQDQAQPRMEGHK